MGALGENLFRPAPNTVRGLGAARHDIPLFIIPAEVCVLVFA